MKITRIRHFSKEDDPECNGDYHGVTLEWNGEVIASYGDHYHDKGYEKSEGFVDGVRWAFRKFISVKDIIEIDEKNVAEITYI